MAMKNVLKQPEKSAQRGPGEKRWACYYCGKEGLLKAGRPGVRSAALVEFRDGGGVLLLLERGSGTK